MLTGRQIRAARAFLEWSAEDLATKAGLNVDTVHKFEKNKGNAKDATVNAFVRTFDIHGIEFLPDEGMRVRKTETRNFVGKEGYKLFLDHIYETVKEGGRICQCNVSDGKTLKYADDYAELHLKRMAEIQNLNARVLTTYGDTTFPASYCKYKWTDKGEKSLIPYYAYNDFLAQAVFKSDNNVEIISTRSKLLTERYVEHFEALWAAAIEPNKKDGK